MTRQHRAVFALFRSSKHA